MVKVHACFKNGWGCRCLREFKDDEGLCSSVQIHILDDWNLLLSQSHEHYIILHHCLQSLMLTRIAKLVLLLGCPGEKRGWMVDRLVYCLKSYCYHDVCDQKYIYSATLTVLFYLNLMVLFLSWNPVLCCVHCR